MRAAAQLTLLSWRRTALRWIVMAVLGARLFSELFGTAAVVVGCVAVVLGLAVHLSASATYRSAIAPDGSVTADGMARLSRATPRLLTLAIASVALGGVTLAWLWWG